MEYKNLMTYIKTNLASSYIESAKLLMSELKLFIC